MPCSFSLVDTRSLYAVHVAVVYMVGGYFPNVARYEACSAEQAPIANGLMKPIRALYERRCGMTSVVQERGPNWGVQPYKPAYEVIGLFQGNPIDLDTEVFDLGSNEPNQLG